MEDKGGQEKGDLWKQNNMIIIQLIISQLQ